MSKSRLIITALAIFLLVGTTSLAGATPPTGAYKTHVTALNFASGGYVAAYFDGLDSNGNTIGSLTVAPIESIQQGSGNVNMASILNSAYWQHKYITLHVYNGYINGVESDPPMPITKK